MPLNRRHRLAAPLAALGLREAHAGITLEPGARDAELPFDRVEMPGAGEGTLPAWRRGAERQLRPRAQLPARRC